MELTRDTSVRDIALYFEERSTECGYVKFGFCRQWSLGFADIDFINSKPGATRLGLAAHLKFFGAGGFFADDGPWVRHDAGEYRMRASGQSCPIFSQSFPTWTTGKRSSSNMTKWSNMKTRTTDPEAILRHVARSETMHPT